MKFLISLLTGAMFASAPLTAMAQDAELAPAPEYVFTEAADDHAMGDLDAPITMIVYASVMCPHCGDWFTNEWPSVKTALIETGQVRFVFREIPTAPAQLAVIGFMMAECGPRDKYFDSLEYQMVNQKRIFEKAKAGTVREEYDKIGAMSGLNTPEEIQACMANRDKLAHIEISGQRGGAAKFTGVPAFFIEGQPYKGSQKAADLTALITDMIAAGVSALPEMPDEPGHDHDHDHSPAANQSLMEK